MENQVINRTWQQSKMEAWKSGIMPGEKGDLARFLTLSGKTDTMKGNQMLQREHAESGLRWSAEYQVNRAAAEGSFRNPYISTYVFP
jgi:hypothetical protein